MSMGLEESLFWKKVASRSSIGKPVFGKNVKRLFGKDGIAIRAVFTMSDVDAHIFPLNVFITEIADFTNVKTGRIHESNHSFRF